MTESRFEQTLPRFCCQLVKSVTRVCGDLKSALKQSKAKQRTNAAAHCQAFSDHEDGRGWGWEQGLTIGVPSASCASRGVSLLETNFSLAQRRLNNGWRPFSLDQLFLDICGFCKVPSGRRLWGNLIGWRGEVSGRGDKWGQSIRTQRVWGWCEEIRDSVC